MFAQRQEIRRPDTLYRVPLVRSVHELFTRSAEPRCASELSDERACAAETEADAGSVWRGAQRRRNPAFDSTDWTLKSSLRLLLSRIMSCCPEKRDPCELDRLAVQSAAQGVCIRAARGSLLCSSGLAIYAPLWHEARSDLARDLIPFQRLALETVDYAARVGRRVERPPGPVQHALGSSPPPVPDALEPASAFPLPPLLRDPGIWARNIGGPMPEVGEASKPAAAWKTDGPAGHAALG